MDEYQKLLEAELSKSDALGPGVQVGKILSINVADGYAYYKVVKVNKRTAIVKWVEELDTDGYKDWNLGDGGSIQIAKIEPMIAYDSLLRKIIQDGKGK